MEYNTIEYYENLNMMEDDNYTSDDTEIMTTSTESTDLNDLSTEYYDMNFIYDNSDDDQHISYYHEIYNTEEEFLNSEKKNGQYILGVSARGFENESIFGCGITSKTFYNYPFKNVLKYLFYYSVLNIYYPVMDIIQIYITNDETYISIRKTYWLILIQKHWKKVMAEREQIKKNRRSLYSLIYREIKGKYPSGLNILPGLVGLLSCYSR